MKEEKHYTQWTREEFEKLPYPESFHNTIGEVESLIILPETHVHDSGFRCMSFVAIQNGKPTYRISGCSDVIHLGGVGGYNWQNAVGLCIIKRMFQHSQKQVVFFAIKQQLKRLLNILIISNMNNVQKILSSEFTKTIKKYIDIKKLLDPMVKKYFETYYEDWGHFSDWYFDDIGENVIINYTYLNYQDEWDFDSISISLDRIIEMI